MDVDTKRGPGNEGEYKASSEISDENLEERAENGILTSVLCPVKGASGMRDRFAGFTSVESRCVTIIA